MKDERRYMLRGKGVLVDFGDRSIAYIKGEDERRYAEEIASVLKDYSHKTLDEVAQDPKSIPP